MVKYWNNLPREMIKAPKPVSIKKCLDNALKYMVQLLNCSVCSQELDLMVCVGAFQLRMLFMFVPLFKLKEEIRH